MEDKMTTLRFNLYYRLEVCACTQTQLYSEAPWFHYPRSCMGNNFHSYMYDLDILLMLQKERKNDTRAKRQGAKRKMGKNEL